jgi:tryptophan-associated transmembrane protein
MGSRYDAPTSRPRPASDQDLWRAIDEGHDPTL